MLRGPFWRSCRVMGRFRGLLAQIVAGSLVSAASFGAGIGMLVPVFALLTDPGQGLVDRLRAYADGVRSGEAAESSPASWFGIDPTPFADAAAALADVMPADRYLQFLLVLGVILVLTLIGSTGRYFQASGAESITIYATRVWRQRLYRRVVAMPMAAIAQRGESDAISRTINDVNAMTQGYRVLLGKTLEHTLRGVFAFGLAIALNWQLTLIAVAAAPVIGLLVRKLGKRVRRATKGELKFTARLLRAMTGAVSQLAVVKVHHAEGQERRSFANLQREVLRQRLKVRQVKALSAPLMDTLSVIVVIVVASIAAWYIFRGNVAPAVFMGVLTALAAAGESLKPLATLNNELQAARAAADRVFELLDDAPQEPLDAASRRGLRPAPRCERDIVFDHLTHHYPGSDRPALDDIRLSLPAGQTVAVVGRNGSGKTTLVSHIPRLLAPTAGRVLIDGVDLATVDLRSLRERIALVSQRTAVFSASVADNIALGRTQTPRDHILAAARAARADEFITQLPDGYDTRLGEEGVGLSGGQMQRLAIARAILRDAPILILDEATSQVDAESEALVQAALAELMHDRTTLVIAHRLATVVDADLIVVLDDGRVEALGKHAELLERSDAYRKLTHSQLAPRDADADAETSHESNDAPTLAG
ncbi:MAG: ABC transporter ATP-binding protein [Planctomycetota bacterium]